MFSCIDLTSHLRKSAALSLCMTTFAFAQANKDPLKAGFENPPNSARPRVWWHWMNGNITKEGIKLDLEWMHRIGIGGYQNFDADIGTPQVVEKRLPYMTPEWKDAFLYATKLTSDFGMEQGIAGSPGWSETGGPWVPPANAMKKYVWTETLVEGGKPLSVQLPPLPNAVGPFQNVSRAGATHVPAKGEFFTPPGFSRVSAVFAYRIPAEAVAFTTVRPHITSSDPAFDSTVLADSDFDKSTSLHIAPGEKAWIQYEYAAPQTLRAAAVYSLGDQGHSIVRTFESSDDGLTFRLIATFTQSPAGMSVAFAPVTARYFRISLQSPTNLASNLAAANAIQRISEITLSPETRVSHLETKAAFVLAPNVYDFATSEGTAIPKQDVIDLSKSPVTNGALQANLPPGHWKIVQLGYSLLGITNHPATFEATGLEVDKLNRPAVKSYIEHYLDTYQSFLGPMMGAHGLRYIINDSYEAGPQNWTDDMIPEFTRRRGYDPTPWLPVLTGQIVQSSKASDQFLWDLRKTIADLMADYHYGQLQESIHARGLGHYGESHESGRALIADGMEVKKMDDIPMSAMWTQLPNVNHEMFGYDADDRESASVAHIYGQNLAAAESMTARAAPWGWYPSALKPTADKEMAEGINRFVIHSSVHQPRLDPGPGLALGPYGQWFNRNETWAEQATPWMTYLARSSYMLQQGKFVADILYFYGEDSNVTAIFNSHLPEVPAGYNFDYLNADALIHAISVQNGHLTTATGMSYRILALDPFSRNMSLPVLRALDALVRKGAIVSGPKPTADPSLADKQAEFQHLADILFGDGTGVHATGQGKVYAGQTLAQVLPMLSIAPDFGHTQPDKEMLFVHRRLPAADIFWIDNRQPTAESIDATFRVTGKVPELWSPETGQVTPITYTIASGKTTIPLALDPWGTAIVVFRTATAKSTWTAPTVTEATLTTMEGPWPLTFEPNRGAPATATLDHLTSWSDNPDPAVKYFSGQATYTRKLVAEQSWFTPHTHLWLNLGEVKNLAEVKVNGKSVGIAWHAPYRVDLTPALHPGANAIEITVINAWVNRLIGDQQPNAMQFTFTTYKPYKADSPLEPSGLLGPVTVTSSTTH